MIDCALNTGNLLSLAEESDVCLEQVIVILNVVVLPIFVCILVASVVVVVVVSLFLDSLMSAVQMDANFS